MKAFTAVFPNRRDLAPDLSLLITPVCAAEPSAPDEYVGYTEGALVDDDGHVVAFFLRLATKIAAAGSRTIVPCTALHLSPGPILHLSWTEDQLRAQPRLDQTLQPHNRVDGGKPIESAWMPARPNIVPPAGGINAREAARESAEVGLIGAAIGGIGGLALGGPLGAALGALFFGGGGSLAGFLAGAAQETATEAAEMKFDNVAEPEDPPLREQLATLERCLEGPALEAAGVVTKIRFVPQTTNVAPPDRPAAEPLRRAG